MLERKKYWVFIKAGQTIDLAKINFSYKDWELNNKKFDSRKIEFFSSYFSMQQWKQYYKTKLEKNEFDKIYTFTELKKLLKWKSKSNKYEICQKTIEVKQKF